MRSLFLFKKTERKIMSISTGKHRFYSKNQTVFFAILLISLGACAADDDDSSRIKEQLVNMGMKQIFELNPRETEVAGYGFSNNGQQIAFNYKKSNDFRTKIRELGGKESSSKKIPELGGEYGLLVYSPDDNHLACVSGSGKVDICDLSIGGKLIRTIDTFPHKPWKGVYSDNGEYFMIGSFNKTARVSVYAVLEDYECIKDVYLEDIPHSLAFHKNVGVTGYFYYEDDDAYKSQKYRKELISFECPESRLPKTNFFRCTTHGDNNRPVLSLQGHSAIIRQIEHVGYNGEDDNYRVEFPGQLIKEIVIPLPSSSGWATWRLRIYDETCQRLFFENTNEDESMVWDIKKDPKCVAHLLLKGLVFSKNGQLLAGCQKNSEKIIVARSNLGPEPQ